MEIETIDTIEPIETVDTSATVCPGGNDAPADTIPSASEPPAATPAAPAPEPPAHAAESATTPSACPSDGLDKCDPEDRRTKFEISKKFDAGQPHVPVRYNHRSLSLPLETAAGYCQQWMHYTAEGGLRDKLTRLAAAEGCSAEEFLDRIARQRDDELRQTLAACADGDAALAERLYRLTATAAEPDDTDPEAALERRLQAEFADVQAEFPELGELDEIPAEAVELALSRHVSLLDGYLRYRRQEEKRIARNQQQQSAAALASAGRQTAGSGSTPDDAVTAAMLAGVRG